MSVVAKIVRKKIVFHSVKTHNVVIRRYVKIYRGDWDVCEKGKVVNLGDGAGRRGQFDGWSGWRGATGVSGDTRFGS